MKLIDAVWEQRNLGVTCIEVELDTTDQVDDVKHQLSTLSAQYIVIKVPTGRPELLFCLSDMGYTFIEGSIHVTWKVRDFELSAIQSRLADSVGYALMNESDVQVLQAEIRKGMFNTDRIYLDPYFAEGQAAERYIGWIQDEIGRGSELYKLTYKDTAIGVFTMKDLGAGVYYPFLAGVYESHRKSGLGFNIIYKPMCEIAKRGGKAISTYVSTNNAKALRIHVSMGFTFEQMAYVYVKHIDSSVKHQSATCSAESWVSRCY